MELAVARHVDGAVQVDARLGRRRTLPLGIHGILGQSQCEVGEEQGDEE